jgi:hypothetical protein
VNVQFHSPGRTLVSIGYEAAWVPNVNGQLHSLGRTMVPTGYEDGRVPDVNGQLPPLPPGEDPGTN